MLMRTRLSQMRLHQRMELLLLLVLVSLLHLPSRLLCRLDGSECDAVSGGRATFHTPTLEDATDRDEHMCRHRHEHVVS
jgi:hypothetical protein